MIKELELAVQPAFVNDYQHLKEAAAKKLKLNIQEITAVQVIRRSIDARRTPLFRMRMRVFVNEPEEDIHRPIKFNSVQGNKQAVIIGSGPAGLFGALRLIELGIKPIILERGKDVQSRRRDLRAIQQEHTVNPDSNYCFGEGGAGTYSDGKLYTRSNKRGNVNRILNILVQHGAQKDILIDAHPHIGSNVLPKVVEAIRETVKQCGGEIHFGSRVTDLIVKNGELKGVTTADGKEYLGDSVLLATGHSARDIFHMLHNHNIKLEAKPYAMGVRIEHPQALIDKIQYNSKKRHENLPASNYSLTCQVGEKGVYSFCMCPGGIIIPAATAPEELVLNGMSISRRDSPYANSGMVVTVDETDWAEYNSHGVFAGLEYQKALEHKMYETAKGKQTAPAQRITDFVKRKNSSSLPATSYIPGVMAAPLHELLPPKISKSLAKALFVFGKKMKGYFTDEAQILATESRTSSPIRIPRDRETLMHVEMNGLFPSGEGAGYAGGIVSAAIDGERCAEGIVKYIGV